MNKPTNLFPLGTGIALYALFALAGTAYAQTDILSAAASSDLNYITIKGAGLQPATGKPSVSLGSYSLTVGNFNNVQITAALPASLKPGTYNLEVTANGTANFDLTIGASGAAGPQGPAGPAGPQGPPGPAGSSGTLALPFSGTAASPFPALVITTTAGSAIVGVSAIGPGVAGQGGASSATGGAGVSALGGGGSGVTTGGPAFSGAGGVGDNPGDGIDVTGAAALNAAGGNGGNGVLAVGGAGGLNGGSGVESFGAIGDIAGDGVYALGGDTPIGCSFCDSGTGGTFTGGGGPAIHGGDGVDGFTGGTAPNGSAAIYGLANTGQYAGLFQGDVNVAGNLSKSGGSFQIDHPLDPANKYLYHSFVESPDMMNVYNGNVTTDGGGHATVTLPDWFQALNSDFRYQLTTIGQPAHAWVAAEVNQNSFAIRTDKPNVKVSWQVTGIRQDAWANAHRIPVEADKAKDDQGHYLHPELFEHSGEPSIVETHHPRPKKRQQQSELKD